MVQPHRHGVKIQLLDEVFSSGNCLTHTYPAEQQTGHSKEACRRNRNEHTTRSESITPFGRNLQQDSTDFGILLAFIFSFAKIFVGGIQMVERAMCLLQNRLDEIREMLQYIDGPTARQIEQEMDRIQRIIDAFRTNTAESD